MRKTTKKFISSIMATIMAISTISAFTVTSYATASSNDVSVDNVIIDENEYLKFANPNSRIDNNGDFEFSIRYSVKSDKFKFSSSKSRITVSAQIEDYIDHTVSDGSEHLCKLTIESGFYSESFNFYADGDTYTFDLVDLDTDKNYTLTITNVDGLSSQRDYVTGTGHITNFSAS